MTVYRIKSLKWTRCKETNPQGKTYWWGPNNSGYTTDITKAGLYTEEEVMRHRQYHSETISEIVPVDIEVWEEEKIQAHKIYLSHEKSQLEEWVRKYNAAKQTMKIAEESILSSEKSINQINMELAIQEMLKVSN